MPHCADGPGDRCPFRTLRRGRAAGQGVRAAPRARHPRRRGARGRRRPHRAVPLSGPTVPGQAPARRNERYTSLAVDGPVPWEMVRDLVAIRRDPLTYLEGVVERFGDLVAFPLPRTPVLLVNKP